MENQPRPIPQNVRDALNKLHEKKPQALEGRLAKKQADRDFIDSPVGELPGRRVIMRQPATTTSKKQPVRVVDVTKTPVPKYPPVRSFHEVEQKPLFGEEENGQ